MQLDEERMEQLTVQLKDNRMLAEDSDGKTDEVSQKLAFVENELEAAEERAKFGHDKVQELDEELQVLPILCNSLSLFLSLSLTIRRNDSKSCVICRSFATR